MAFYGDLKFKVFFWGKGREIKKSAKNGWLEYGIYGIWRLILYPQLVLSLPTLVSPLI